MECEGIPKRLLDITNGCGSSYWAAWIFRIPKWVSKKLYCCCGCHDIKYQLGMDKEVADLEIKACIYYDAFKSPWYSKWLKIKTANLIYWTLNTELSKKCYKKAN